jgi:carbonic anhydrase
MTTENDRLRKLLEGHREQSGDHAVRNVLRQLAIDGQKPDALVVCCSDSRVIPEAITGAGPGNLFVVRNVANLIPPHGSGNQSVGAAIAYAVGHLHVGHLIVIGHYGCGGMSAMRDVFHPEHATSHAHDDVLPAWLKYGEASWDELVASGHMDAIDWHDRLVEQNVLQQLANTITYPMVREAVTAQTLALHAWTFDMKAGKLRFWDMDRDAFVQQGAAADSGGSVTIAEIEEQDQVK